MLIKEMVPSNTSCQAKGQVPFSLLMRTQGIFMLQRGWIEKSRPTTHSEHKFRTSMTMSQNFWMVLTLLEFLRCLLGKHWATDEDS
uniref:Uncharacterized protein n=1 Tax=Pavo cristatus TaxID=9049 RepID=A0A8C9FXP3_PAVCR